MSSRKILRSKRKKSSIVPIIVIICSAVTFSAILAGVWQLNSPKIEVLSPLELDPSVTSQFSSSNKVDIISSSSSTESTNNSDPSSEPPESLSVATSSSSLPSPPQNQALDEQPRVSSSYFDDAIFIGDSITVGIKLYDVMSNANVIAATGIGLENIFTKKAIKQDGENITVLDALSKSSGKKVYIMLGANSLMADYDYLISQYGLLIDEVLKRTDDNTIIYVQSILPINEPLFHKRYAPNNTTNEDIDRFNQKLCAMAAEKGVYYLDVASVFKDDNNSMPEINTPDGMHIISSQYIIWFDYLKTHAIS